MKRFAIFTVILLVLALTGTLAQAEEDSAPIELHGFGQAFYQYLFLDPDQAPVCAEGEECPAYINNTFGLQKVWLKLNGGYGNFSYFVVGDLLTTESNIKQAWLAYSPGNYFKFKFGQQFIPFSLSLDAAPDQLPFVYYPTTESNISPTFQRGAAISGKFLNGTLGYTAAVFDGNGIEEPRDNNEKKDLVGRIDLNPFSYQNWGLSLGGAWRNGATPVDTLNAGTSYIKLRVWQAELAYLVIWQETEDIERFGQTGWLVIAPVPEFATWRLTGRIDTDRPNLDEEAELVNLTAGTNFNFGHGFSAMVNFIYRDEVNQVEVHNNEIVVRGQFRF